MGKKIFATVLVILIGLAWASPAMGLSMPTVVTSTPVQASSTSLTAGGNVTAQGSGAVTERGICWSTTSPPTIAGTHTASGSGTGTFTVPITGLTEGTLYYVCAYATNSLGTSYGDPVLNPTDIRPIIMGSSAPMDSIYWAERMIDGDFDINWGGLAISRDGSKVLVGEDSGRLWYLAGSGTPFSLALGGADAGWRRQLQLEVRGDVRGRPEAAGGGLYGAPLVLH